MPAYLHQAYRRNAQAAAKNHRVRKKDNEDLLELARENFGYFCEYVADKPPAQHHLEWHKQLVTNQDSDCLLKIAGPNVDLLAPRGSAKSTILGLLTAWAIGIHTTAKKPLQILYISYTVDIARAKSATIKRIIESKKYQEVFPTVKLLKNVTSNEYWSIDHRFAGIDTTGEEQFTLCAAGLKGSVTSKRSHLCFTGSTPVLTDVGLVPIKTIHDNPDSYRVLTVDPGNGKTEWSSLSGVSRRFANRFIRVETTDGTYVEATEDHPFVTSNRGVVQAGNLQEGDILYSFSKVPRFLQSSLSNLQQMVPNQIKLESAANCEQKDQSILLQRPMQVNSSFFNDGGLRKQQLQRTATPCSHSSVRCNHGERWNEMFCLWNGKTPVEIKSRSFNISNQSCSASYRCQPKKQCSTKLDYSVPTVPYWISPTCGKSEASTITISRVERICRKKEYVYDLETSSSNHNFFAGKNSLYVLNCLLDDVVKSSSDIANPDIRKMMQDNWNAVIAPTMFEGGRAICLGTRFRHDDIHATTFNEQNNWMQIVLSAIQNNEITGEEESYWPEMWSLDYLKEKKRQAPIAFSFQYMNQIVRQNELSLAPELLVKAEIATEFDSLAVGVDLSAGTKEKNDYTVFVLGGKLGDQIHIIDYRRMRVMGNLEKLDALKELLNDWSILGRDENGNYFPTYNTCDVYSEAVAYQASLEADFKRICLRNENLYNINWHAVKGFRADKLARFRGCMGLFEDRKVIFNRYRNFTSMFEELTNFGVSSHDDCIDALVWLINGLTRKGVLQVDY